MKAPSLETGYNGLQGLTLLALRAMAEALWQLRRSGSFHLRRPAFTSQILPRCLDFVKSQIVVAKIVFRHSQNPH